MSGLGTAEAGQQFCFGLSEGGGVEGHGSCEGSQAPQGNSSSMALLFCAKRLTAFVGLGIDGANKKPDSWSGLGRWTGGGLLAAVAAVAATATLASAIAAVPTTATAAIAATAAAASTTESTAAATATAAIATATATESAGPRRAFLTGPGDVYRQGAAFELITVEFLHGLLCFVWGAHGDEGETTGTTGELVEADFNYADGTGLAKQGLEVLCGASEGKIPDVELGVF